MNTTLPSLEDFKLHTKLFKAIAGKTLKHGHALDLLSQQYGFSNWNICRKKLTNNSSVIGDASSTLLLRNTIKVLEQWGKNNPHLSPDEEDKSFIKFIDANRQLYNRFIKEKFLVIPVEEMPYSFTITGDDKHIYQIDEKLFIPDNMKKILSLIDEGDMDNLKEFGIIKILLDKKDNDFSDDFFRHGRWSPELFQYDESALSEEQIREIASLKKRTDEVVAANTTKIVLPKVAHLPVNLPVNLPNINTLQGFSFPQSIKGVESLLAGVTKIFETENYSHQTLPENTNLIEFPSEDQDVVLETALYHINAHRKFGASIEKSTQVLDEADNIRSGKQDSDKKNQNIPLFYVGQFDIDKKNKR